MVRNVRSRSKEGEMPNLVLLWMVVPGVPKNEREKALLQKDLYKMGSHDLLERP